MWQVLSCGKGALNHHRARVLRAGSATWVSVKQLCGSHRGGGEYGLDWWEGGRLHKKQNGFDDFASCAQYLHSAGFSSPAKLTVQARSI